MSKMNYFAKMSYPRRSMSTSANVMNFSVSSKRAGRDGKKLLLKIKPLLLNTGGTFLDLKKKIGYEVVLVL